LAGPKRHPRGGVNLERKRARFTVQKYKNGVKGEESGKVSHLVERGGKTAERKALKCNLKVGPILY